MTEASGTTPAQSVAAPADHEGFDVFVSYRSASSRPQAQQVSLALFNLSKRHLVGRNLRVFLDTDDLTAGSLDRNITRALDGSRTLVVCLDPTTVDSPWVSKEIDYWLTHGGHPSRMFLVRTNPALDLSWDAERGTFTAADAIPVPLRTAYAGEQKYFDVFSARKLDASLLAGLYAAVMAIDPADLLLDESRYQRQRRVVQTAVTAGLALLLILAIIAGIVAFQQSRRSAASARTATGEAAAAEALLTLPYSYPDAIAQVLEASRLSDSPSVRSALIAVASSTGALRRTLDWAALKTGHRAAGMSFSRDGYRLLAWGPAAAAGRSHLAAWSVISGELLVDTDVEVADMANTVEVGAVGYLACSGRGPVLVDRHSFAVRSLPDGDLREGGGSCRTASFGGGALVELRQGEQAALTTYVSYAGTVSTHPDAWIQRANPDSWSAVLRTFDGLILASARGEATMPLRDISEVRLASARGTVLVKTAKAWYLVQHSADGRTATRTRLRVPADASSVSLYEEYRGPKDTYAWITTSGEVGWSRSSATTQLADPRTGTPPAPPEILPNGYGSLVAVSGTTAYVLMPPDRTKPWRSRPVATDLRTPDDGGSVTTAYCDSGDAIGLSGGQWLISEFGSTKLVQTASEEAYLDGCTLVDPGPPLAVDGVKVSEGALDGTVVIAPRYSGAGNNGDGVAVVRPDAVTQVLNTGGPGLSTGGRVEHTWRVFQEDSVVAALGERTISTNDDETISSAPGTDPIVLGDKAGPFNGIGPDGLSAVVASTVNGKTRNWLVQGGQSTPACDAKQVSYLPGPDFARSVADAERAVPVMALADGWQNCSTGQSYAFPSQVSVDDYQVGASRARILWSQTQGKDIVRRITTWTPGRPDSLQTRDLPPVDRSPHGTVRAEVDVTTDHLLLSDTGSGVVRSWTWIGGGWRAGPIFQGSIGGVHATGWSADATLVFSFNAGGGFELFDATSGRRLIVDQSGVGPIDDPPTSVFVTESDGFSYAHVTTGTIGEVHLAVEVAVRVDRLRELLCVVHRAPACDR
jgi:hypothetical protein